MKVTCLLGSPRKNGNSTLLARKLCDTLEHAGAEIHYYELNKMNYRGCQACDVCQKQKRNCILRDDLAEVFETVQDSDVVIFASPVYFGDVSAQLKGYIDRSRCFIDRSADGGKNSRLKPGIKFAMILTQAAPEGYYQGIHYEYERLFQVFTEDMHLIQVPGVLREKEILNRPEFLRQAEDIAKKLLRWNSSI
ncbi:MAG: flavodoxin family protein [Gammaproteobacteria bacterium]|nr:flavodoxin family protein [Gammaproteobacteria bacterium]